MRKLIAAFVAPAVAALTFLVVPTAGAAPPPARRGLSWQVQRSPFLLTFSEDGRPLVGQASGGTAGPGGRMAYALDDGSTHRLTDLTGQRAVDGGVALIVATDEPGRTAQVTVTRGAQGLRVSWTLQPATGVVRVFEALTGDDGEHFIGGGATHLFVDLRHHAVLDKVLFNGAGSFDSCTKSSAASPFFLSSHGYGIWADTTAIGRTAFPNAVDSPPDCGGTDPPPCPVQFGQPDRTQLCFKTDHLAYEVYAGSPAQIVHAFTARTGRPAMPPLQQFGLMKWRDTVHGTDDVLEDADQFERLGIPLHTLWIDNPWEIENAPPDQASAGTSCMGTLQFDPRMFPDPKGMIDNLHARDVHLGLWISPYVSVTANGKPCPDTGFPPGSLIPAPGDSSRRLVDFTDPAGREHWQQRLRAVLSMGVDMVKGDRGDGERDLEKSTLAAGPGTEYANLYPLLYEQATAQVLQGLYGNDYAEVFRGGYTGSPAALHGFWQGDQHSTFEAMRNVIRRGQTSWQAGSPVWGSDTGGYGSPSAPLFTRWAQLSAVSPVFEVGGGGRNNTPWEFDQQTVDRFRDAAVLHSELVPYLYRLAQDAHATGMPITRPLGMVYPDDEQAWSADQEFLVGDDLLAAPVAADRAGQDGQLGRATPVDVYLPAGDWVDAFTGEVYRGDQHVVRPSGMDDFPLYVRQGSAIPFDWRTPDVWAKPWGVNDLMRDDRAGWLYAPRAGDAHAQSPNGGSLTAHTRGGDVRIDLQNAPKETEILVPAAHAPTSLRIGGRPVPQTGSVSGLRNSEQGWAYQQNGVGGRAVLLKLAPSAGSAGAELTFPGPPGAARTPVSVGVQQPDQYVAGATTQVTTTFTDHATSGPPLRDVHLDLPAPDGWTVEAQGPSTFDTVRPGQTVTATFDVTPVVGQAYLTPEAHYTDPAVDGEVPAYGPSNSVLVKASGDLVEVVQPQKLAALRYAAVGTRCYVDRDFTITALPDALSGQLLVPGANDDKNLTEPTDYLQLRLKRDATVYVAFDTRGDGSWWPQWLADKGFQRTEMTIDTTDAHFAVFSHRFSAGDVVLGPNSATSGSASSYFALVSD